MSSNTTYLLCQFSLNMSDTNIDTRRPSSAMFAALKPVVVAVAILSPCCSVGEWFDFGSNLKEPFSQNTFLHSARWIGHQRFLRWTNESIALLEPYKNYSMSFAIDVLCFEYFGSLTISTVTDMSIERWLHMVR